MAINLEILDASQSQLTQNEQVKNMIDKGCDVVCVNLVDRTDEGIEAAQKQPLTLSKNRAEKTLNSCASSQPLKGSNVSTKHIRMFRFTVDTLIVN